MEVDDVPAAAAAKQGTKRRAGTAEASGLEEDWRWEEELRGSKVHRGSCWSRHLPPDIREFLHHSRMVRIQGAAIVARSRKEREELARCLELELHSASAHCHQAK